MTSLAVDELSQLLSEARAKLLELISENDDAQSGEALALDRAAARARSLRDEPASSLEGLGLTGGVRSCATSDRSEDCQCRPDGRGCYRAIRSRSLVAEQKKKISVSFFRDCIRKNPKLSRQAVHRLLRKASGRRSRLILSSLRRASAVSRNTVRALKTSQHGNCTG